MRSKTTHAAYELLQDIAVSVESIQRYVNGMDFNSFLADDKTVAAVERKLQILTEAAIRLGSLAEEVCPGPNWPDIRGFGNVLRHAYDGIDIAEVWSTVTRDLPPLLISVTDAIHRLEATQ